MNLLTIRDVSKKTGYSPTTVSKAFNNYSDISVKTKEKILKVAREMGYFPNSHARTLSTKKSWMLGVLYVEPFGMGIRHPFFNAIIESFKKNIEANNYDLMFISKDIGDQQFTYLQHCQFRSLDGIIVVHSDYNEKEVQELLKSEIPCVLVDMESKHASTVCSDNERGGFLAGEYLYSLGHRKIAHISGGYDTFTGPERKKGFKRSLHRHGLEIRDEWLINGGFFTYEDGYKAMKELLKQEELPTAVFVAGDYMAVGAMQAIEDHGLQVPKDISVIGFDDIDLAQFTSPKLTTIKQNTNLIGEKAAKMLINSIDSYESITKEVVPIELMKRESCRTLE